MKMLTTILTVLAISAGVACAQNTSGNANNPASPGSVQGTDVTGFRAPTTIGPVQSSKFPNLHPNLQPQVGGVIYDGVTKYGGELVNPAAAASYGVGEKYLTAPSPTQDVQHESGPAAHRQSGGIKVFSFEF